MGQKMETLRIIILITGSLAIIFGYLRFITDDKGNVDLNNYRFTGGLGEVIFGLLDGTRDVFSHRLTANAISAVVLYFGVLLFYIGFRM